MKFFDSPFWGRGFRPFFLLGALYSACMIVIWGGFYADYISPPSVISDPIFWHAHEMIYGFSMAIVAGFLLTAVANWTGGAPARQGHLAALCCIWGVGRFVMNVDLGLPVWMVAVLDGSFLPALAVTLAIPLLHSRNKRNFIFLGLLTILCVCDLMFFFLEDMRPLYVALFVILTMVSLIGGRIIPAFTVSALRYYGHSVRSYDQTFLDIAALISLLLVMVALAFWGSDHYGLGVCAAVSSLIHAARLRGYHTAKTFVDPMLWILHAGYIWLIIGLGLVSLSAFGVVVFSTALHALTVGTIGSMTIGMMCRVALGHTGRNIRADSTMTFMFGAMQFAAIIRVFGPLFFPDSSHHAIIGSATLWSGIFFLYVLKFMPILKSVRPDGQAA